jgi:Flp pilus assembly protein TadG
MPINKALMLKAATSGSSVVEFALIAPVFASMIVGGLYACLALFTAGSLQYAVQKGARCASVSATNCATSATTITYTQNAYIGPAKPAPTFTYSTPSCGYQMHGSVNFVFNFVYTSVTVPIATSSCFP